MFKKLGAPRLVFAGADCVVPELQHWLQETHRGCFEKICMLDFFKKESQGIFEQFWPDCLRMKNFPTPKCFQVRGPTAFFEITGPAPLGGGVTQGTNEPMVWNQNPINHWKKS